MTEERAERESDIETVIEQLRGKTEHPKIGFGYRLGLALVALGMVILPLLYVSMVAGVGWLTYLHATKGVAVFEHSSGSGSLLVYIAPLCIGIISFLFLIKPLFARPSKGGEAYEVTRGEHPRLFAYLDALCANLGAPAPKRVVIDTQVNASAGFTKGMFGWLTNHLTLTIGTPLVSGLTLEQLTGVLAHEFGHFAQSGGMRLSYVIRTINHWFLRVVYERDTLDRWLDETRAEVGGRIGLILALASFCVWLSRRILWALMRVGDLMSCYLLRQMEFDADLNEIHVVGAATFERSSLRFLELSVGEREAQSTLGTSFQEGRMSADYGGMVSTCANELGADVLKQIREGVEKEKTDLLATHPCTRERIERAMASEAEVVVACSAGSEELFNDYPTLTEQVSTRLYNHVFGDAMKDVEIQSNADIIARRDNENADFAGLETFFGNLVSFARPISPPELPTETATAETIEKSREEWTASLPSNQESLKRHNELLELDEKLTRMDELHNCELKWKEQAVGFPMESPDEVESQKNATRKTRTDLEESMAEWETRSRERLAHSLARARQTADESSAEEIDRLSAALRNVVDLAPRLHSTRKLVVRLEAIFAAHNADLSSDRMGRRAYRIAEMLREDLQKIQAELAEITYPFDHALGEVSLDQVYLREIPAKDDLGTVYETANSTYGEISRLYYRVLGRLGRIAHKAMEAQKDGAATATSAE